MMQTLLTNLAIVFYLIMACCFFVRWLDFFIDDKEMNSAQRCFSMVILILATILWPFIVPLASEDVAHRLYGLTVVASLYGHKCKVIPRLPLFALVPQGLLCKKKTSVAKQRFNERIPSHSTLTQNKIKQDTKTWRATNAGCKLPLWI